MDDDVAALLARAQKARKTSLKEVVNDALRQGLQQMAAPKQPAPAYVTPGVDLGPCLIGSLDDVAGVLAIAEGAAYK